MKAIIVNYDCTDHDPIDEWVPENDRDVDFWMNFTIGLDKSSGDNFQVRIISPIKLRNKTSKKFTIVIEKYSWISVLSAVEKILEQCQGSDWLDISEQLSQFMYWEFEDYR
jgi:hypothetical protein